jgi:hypothetical protein
MTISRPDDFPDIETYTDEKGRQFHYIHLSRPETRKLLIHFTAFFGDWGERQQYRHYYQGYFHRFRMFRNVTDYSCLFLCDQFGADSNGTYYTGEKGDFFVERAMLHIITQVMQTDQAAASNVVTIGSSMGATGALKFGLMLKTKGIVSISPHIDLDTSAKYQNRMPHVSFVVPDGDALSIPNRVYTRQVSNAVAAWDQSHGPLPRLVMIGCADDHGAYKEQIVPLTEMWRQKGGQLALYIRPTGGHTSEYATEAVLHDVVRKVFEEAKIDSARYVSDRTFWSETEETLSPNIVADQNQEATALEPDALEFSRNPDLVSAAADYLIATATAARRGLTVAFMPQIDDVLKGELLRRGREGDLKFQIMTSRPNNNRVTLEVAPPPPLVSPWGRFIHILSRWMGGSTPAAKVHSLPSFILEFTAADGTSVPVDQSTSDIALIMNGAFYGLPRDKSQDLLASLPGHVKFLLILDQADNYDARESEVRTLADDLGRSYETECHDFRNLLETAGFSTNFMMPLPYPAKSLSGVIVAARSADVSLDDFFRHLRTAKKVAEPWATTAKFPKAWEKFDLRQFTGKMVGQFIIPSCAPAGLRIEAYIRNTARDNEPFPTEVRNQGLAVDLRVFAKGELIYHNPQFARVPLNGVQEISEKTCPALAGDQSDLLVVAECSLPSDGETFFSQEHQLRFENPSTGVSGSVLYDHLPLITTSKKFSPIVLLAPKVWVGSHFNSFVAFASSNSSTHSAKQSVPLTVTILDQEGHQIGADTFDLMENSVFLFNVKKALAGKVELGPRPRFFNVVAKGGASSFVIVTFVINEETGNFALEHSLSPHYYAAEGLPRVRNEALRFRSTQGA